MVKVSTECVGASVETVCALWDHYKRLYVVINIFLPRMKLNFPRCYRILTLDGYQEVQMHKVRLARIQAGLSQDELAEKANVSQHTISEVELGRRRPQGKTLRKLAAALDVSIPELIGEVEQDPKVSSPPSLEWALAASDEEFDGWVESAVSADLHRLFFSFDKYAEGLGDRDRRLEVLGRAQKAIDQFFRLQGIDQGKSVDRWPSKATENEGREAG